MSGRLATLPVRVRGLEFCIAALLSTLLPACGSQKEAVLEVHEKYRAAVLASDLAGLARCLSAGRQADLEAPGAEATLDLVAGFSPDDPAVKSVDIDGDEATIELEALLEGETATGTVRLLREGGAWKVDKEEWAVEIDLGGGSGSGDWAARLREEPAARPRAVRSWAAHEGVVTRVAFTADGQYVVSIGYDDYSVRVWDRATGGLVSEAKTPARPTDLVVHPKRNDVILSNVDGDVLVYPFSFGELGEPRELADVAGPSARLALSADGRTLATAGFGVPARLWNLEDGARQKTLSDSKSLRGLAFSPKGNLLAAGTMGNEFVLWDLDSNGPFGRKPVTIPGVGEKSDVWTVAVSPDGSKLLTGHMDSSITLWEIRSRKQLRNTFVRDASTFAVAFSPDGTLFASAQQNGKVYLWETASAMKLLALEGHDGPATTVAFNPFEWEVLATGGEDGRIIVWM